LKREEPTDNIKCEIFGSTSMNYLGSKRQRKEELAKANIMDFKVKELKKNF